jgi:hypothetical protein
MGRAKVQRKALAVLNYDLFSLEDLSPPAPATIHSKIQLHRLRQQPIAAVDTLKLIPTTLPSIEQLYRMFNIYNWTYYEGKLPQVTIEYSSRMTSAGSYIPARKLIRIGRKYHEIYPNDVTDTLKHEMIHIGCSFQSRGAPDRGIGKGQNSSFPAQTTAIRLHVPPLRQTVSPPAPPENGLVRLLHKGQGI